MRKRRPPRHTSPVTATQAANSQTIEAFTFGEPVPVLSQREVFDYLEAMHNGRWYEPPLSLNGLSRVYRAGVHHASAIQVKRNILRSCFIPHPKLSLAAFPVRRNDHPPGHPVGNGRTVMVPDNTQTAVDTRSSAGRGNQPFVAGIQRIAVQVNVRKAGCEILFILPVCGSTVSVEQPSISQHVGTQA